MSNVSFFLAFLILEDEHRTDRGKNVMYKETGSYHV